MSTPNQGQIFTSTPSPNTPYHSTEDVAHLASISPSTIFLHDGVLRSFHVSTLKEFEQQQAAKFHDALTISSLDQMEELMAIGLSSSSPPTTSGSLQNGSNRKGQNSNGSSANVSTDLLSRKILKLATLHVQTIGLHHRYQWHILEKAWRYQNARALEKHELTTEATALSFMEPLLTGGDSPFDPNNGLGFKLSLCLMVPMLEMYSNQNNSVALSALQLLFSELSSVPVMSLSQESSHSLEKLEDLLGRWAANPLESFQCIGPSAMITLCCARGVISSFAKTILMLENLDSPMRPLPVAQILRKLNNSRLKISKPSAILGEMHVCTWAYDDRLMGDVLNSGKNLGAILPPAVDKLLERLNEEKGDSQLGAQTTSQQTRPTANPTTPNTVNTPPSANGPPPPEEIQKHFVATDGTFLFVTGPNGKGVSKIGTGLNGSLQGWVYHNNCHLKTEFLAYADGLLISRTAEIDTLDNAQRQKQLDDTNSKMVLGVIIDKNTLKPDRLLMSIAAEDQSGLDARSMATLMTLAMISDGSLIYFVKAEIPPPNQQNQPVGNQSGGELSPPIQVWTDIYEISTSSGGNVTAIPKYLKIPLILKAEDGSTTTGGTVSSGATTASDGNRITLMIGEDSRGGNSVRRTRSVRITPAAVLPPPPPPPPSGAASFWPGDLHTTMNVTLRQLQHALYFTCGNYLTVVVPNNAVGGGGPLVLASSASGPAAPGGPSLVATARQYTPVVSANCTKSIGLQYHFFLQHTQTKISSKQDLSNLPQDSSFFHGAIVPEMGAAYDATNNVIWTLNGNLIDCWKNPGHIPPWKQNKMLLLGNTTNDLISVEGTMGQTADVKTVINVILRHAAIMANHFLSGDQDDANIGFELLAGPLSLSTPPTPTSLAVSGGVTTSNEKNSPGGVLKTLIELLCKYRSTCEGSELTALFLSLRAIVSQISRNVNNKMQPELNAKLKKELYNAQVMVLCLLNDEHTQDKFRDNPFVYQEACSLFATTFDLLYTSAKARSDFFEELYQYLEGNHDEMDNTEFEGHVEDDDVEGIENCKKLCAMKPSSPERLRLLEDTILRHFTESLKNHPIRDFLDGMKWVVAMPWLLKVTQQAIRESRVAIVQVADAGFSEEQVISVTSNYPVTSISTMYLNSVVDYFLKSLVLLPTTGSSSFSSSSNTELLPRDITDLAVEIFREILKAGPIIIDNILEVIFGSDSPISYGMYCVTEAILKSSLLGHGISQILGFLSLDNVPRPILDELTEECIQLTVAMSFLAKKMNPGSSSNGSGSTANQDLSEDWSSKVHVFSPWTTKRVYESPHPIRESFKTKETIVIPGARQLYLKLSPQCATQYDYDRLAFLTANSATLPTTTSSQVGGTAAGSQTSKKILEFGGNYYGFGNRFFSGPGWARQLIKLCDGPGVQYNFEVKSGREHGVPDKALWGYKFIIFPLMDTSDSLKPPMETSTLVEGDGTKNPVSPVTATVPLSPITPGFATITALHCIDVIQNVSRVLLEGCSPSPEEKSNKVLLENRLVAGLKWSKADRDISGTSKKFPPELVAKVKRAVGIPPLQMRMSIIEKMRASELEELYLQCCMAHVGPNPFLSSETLLSPVCESCWSMDPTRDVLREVFHNIDTMFRRLMAFYEMEKMLSQEIEEISNHTKDISDAFFSDPSFMENPTDMQTLAWICYLDYDKDSPKSLISDVVAMCMALSADPATPPQLTRTDELIEETHFKCKQLLQALPSSTTTASYIGPVYPTQKMIIEKLQLVHNFISAHLYNPYATMASFTVAVRNRRERAGDRIKGLDILRKVIECSNSSSALLIVTSLLLQSGPRLQSILCSGLEKDVLKIYGEVMKSTVTIAEKNPLLHRYTIALLSITAYDRTDEENLVESGLVGVLDQLCAYQTGHLTPLYQRNSPTQSSRMQENQVSLDISPEMTVAYNKASTLAWAAFQVLASQCASWERSQSHQNQNGNGDLLFNFLEGPASPEWEESEHRELSLQISINITNHLARAAALAALSSSFPDTMSLPAGATCSPSLAVAIQDVLDLLNNLRTYKIGRAILKQSPCICRLLGLLQDSRLSPRLVLTILKLLHTALPLVDDLDTANFKQIVPFSRGAGHATTFPNGATNGGNGSSSKPGTTPMSSFWSVIESTPYTQVASMLLSKLADYLVCGSVNGATPPVHSKMSTDPNTKLPSCAPGQFPSYSQQSNSSTVQGLTDPSKYDRMEVWVYKSSHIAGDHHQSSSNNSSSLVRQLFLDVTRQDLKPTRGTLTELENELNANGKVLLYTDESNLAERKAMRISQLGHLVTLLPAGWSRTLTVYNSGATSSGVSSGGTDLLCKDRNNYLASWDPARPFLSGHVAENMSSEIVQLLRALLNTSTRSSSYSSLKRKSQSMSSLSMCGSRSNVLHQTGSSAASLASGAIGGIGGTTTTVLCTGGDIDSLASATSAHLQVSGSSTQKSSTPSAWPAAVEQIVCAALKLLPKLCQMPSNPTGVHLESYVYSARLVIAALTVLGGFTETIRNGLEVWIVDEPRNNVGVVEDFGMDDQWEYKATKARVISVSDASPTAKVELISGGSTSNDAKNKTTSGNLTIADILTVPVSRLVPAHFTKCGQQNLPTISRQAQVDLAGFLKTLLTMPSTGGVPSASTGPSCSKSGPSSTSGGVVTKECPLKRELPNLNQIVNIVNPTLGGGTTAAMNAAQTQLESRQIAQTMTIVRLLAEIRTKSLQVLSLWLKRTEFRDIFLGSGNEPQGGTPSTSSKAYAPEIRECTENLKELSKLCVPSHKANSLEYQVAGMRLLYRDCTKPPRLPISDIDKPSNGGDDVLMRWDLSRQQPKIKCAVFSTISNSLVYTGDYNVSGGNPRGLVLFGNGTIPPHDYYWETTIVTMEEAGLHADLIVVPPLSIGFSPLPSSTSTNNDIWKYPSGTVMYTTLGRVVHYKTQDPGSWVSLRLNDDMLRVKAGDTIGIGWERQSESQTSGVTGPVIPIGSQRFNGRARRSQVAPVPAPGRQTLAAVMLGIGSRNATRSTNQLGSDSASLGRVYFTFNGRRLSSTVEQSNCNLHPIVHVQKRQMIVSTNLGERPFLYAEANKLSAKVVKSVGRTLGAPSASAHEQRNAMEAATSNADVLLRRVSDSLQDLSLVFNMNVNEFDSEPELPVVVQRSGSSSTMSATSTRARRGDRVEVEEEEEDHQEPDDDDWNLDDDDNDDAGVGIAADDDDDNDDNDEDDDDSDPTEGTISEPNISGRAVVTEPADEGTGYAVLPPSPVSGVSTSGSSIAIRRTPAVPPPPPPPPSAVRQRHNHGRPSTARNVVSNKKHGGKKPTNNASSLSRGGDTTKKKNQVTGKVPLKHAEYNPIKSLEYFLGHSPTASIKVFQGPRRYVCPCSAHTPMPLDYLLLQPSSSPDTSTTEDRVRSTDMESLDSFEDDDGEDDIHSQLVKAWEQQVFPVIRRRFRNDTERRDGLEQIRGALQLGMWDIARQTVEFLYEEGGGLPRDLHFPTLDEVRVEQARCTMDKLKPGMNVVIRPISQQQNSASGSQNQRNSRQQPQSSDMTLLPPPYAIATMLRTFGLTGEVLEVDVSHDLVLVETYIESEGVLVRFWYPVSCLDKSQSNQKPMLSTNTVNMFKLHSHLISLESCISHAYARQCYLSISHHSSKNVVPSTTPNLSEDKKEINKPPFLPEKIGQEFGLDSLQILSDACLSSFPPSRDLFTYNLQCETPPLKFLIDPVNPSVLFYHRGDHTLLSHHLRYKIRECLQESTTLPSGEDPLDKLTESMLSCFASPEKFVYYDLRLDRIHDLEVHCPGAAFTLVSFKGSQNMTAKQLNSIDNTNHPCFHVFSYDSSEITRYPMACYPLEPLHVVMHRSSSDTGEDAPPSILTHTQTTTAGAADSSAAAAINKTMRKRHSRFPPLMCPTDRVYCSISEISLPDITAEIQGLPKEFPLALLYLQELIRENESVRFENITFAVSLLLDFLDQIHLCPVVKDWIFPLIADLTRIRSKDQDLGWRPAVTEKVARSSTPNRLFLELLLLRERESAELSLPTHTVPLITALGEHLEGGQSFTSPNTSHKGAKQLTPASLMFHISNFISSHQKSKKSMTEPNFSFYFNSLNDLCLALNEVSEIMVNPYEIIPCSTHPSTAASPAGTPPRKTSNTNTETTAATPGVSSTPSSQIVPYSAVTKRQLARATRKRQTPPTRDGFKILKDFKKSGGPSGASTSTAALAEKSTVSNGATTKGGPLTTTSEDGFLVFAKASEVEWFNNQVVISRVLKNIVWYSPNDVHAVEASQVLIGTVLEKLKPPTIYNRLLVIQGAPVNIDGMSIEASLIRALRGCGGIHGNELWISENSAVVEIRSLAKVNEAFETLRQNYVWYPLEDYVLYPNVNVFKVNEDLKVVTALPTFAAASAASSSSGNNSGQEGDKILEKFLKSKLADPEMPGKINFKTREVLTSIFMSCYGTSIPYVIEPVSGGESEGEDEDQQEREQRASHNNVIILSEEQMSLKMPGNLLELFMGALRGSPNLAEPEKDALTRFGEKMTTSPLILDHRPDDSQKSDPGDIKDGECTSSKSHGGSGTLGDNSEEQPEGPTTLQQETVGLSLHGFLDWCTDFLKSRPNLLWKALFSAGYDLHLERVWVCQDPPEIYTYFHSPEKWQLEKDAALISYVDQFSQSLHIDPTRIQPSELNLTESDFLNPSFSTLQGVPTDYLRVRWGMLQKMNTLISKKLLAHGSWHTVWSSRRSLANLLHSSRQLLLYHTKDTYLYKITHVSASRGSDTPTPELILDPVSSIGSQDETVFKNQLSQVIQQMATITTAFYCVPPAQGADPALPLSVKFQGEEVLGLSGSFRHFLLSAAKELQSDTVKLLCRCPSADAGRNKDSFIITPGKLSYGEEDFLYFLGQLIGISIRSEAPLALSLLGATWRALLLSEKESNDISDDLVEADVLCATYLRKLESLSTKAAFDSFLSLNAWPKFKYPSMDSTSVVPLCVDGSSIGLNFTNREQFIKMVKQFREKELRSSNKVTKILTGLATIAPLPALLGLFTSDHLALRIAGSPDVNLSLLKSHTHYQVGVSENDPHIMYFWAALESFSSEELKKFIKFSANLERLPVTCPCQSTEHAHSNHDSTGSSNTNHVPPFPMKIAPIEIPPGATAEEIDRRLIRVETCLFLIRLPPYSSLQVTRQQLLFAINCREDPLSG